LSSSAPPQRIAPAADTRTTEIPYATKYINASGGRPIGFDRALNVSHVVATNKRCPADILAGVTVDAIGSCAA
jgi:hypothetical protein